MIKRLLCVLLSLVLAATVSFSLAEGDAAAEPAAEAQETLSHEPILVVTVNGKQIMSDDPYYMMMLEYLLYVAENYYGYDTSVESTFTELMQVAMYYTIRTRVMRQKAEELNLNAYTDADVAQWTADAVDDWNSYVDSYALEYAGLTEEATEDEKAAARADIEAAFEAQGYDASVFTAESVESRIDERVEEVLLTYLLDGKTVTDEEVQAYFDSLVKADREQYENDVAQYEYSVNYSGASPYYTPEGFRGIIHILLKVDQELLDAWKDLAARYEEQKDATEEPTGETPADAEAEPAELTATPEPVTEEMVEAARQAILDSVKDTLDEIKTKLDNGVAFTDLIKEYGTDSGMEVEEYLTNGYAVHKDSIIYDPDFQAAAMALEKIGDVSDPVVTQFGIHILQYLKDVPGGAAELTDELKEELRGTLFAELKNDVLNTGVDQWMAEADVVYTEAGQAWKLPEEETEGGTAEAAPAETAEEPAAEPANP